MFIAGVGAGAAYFAQRQTVIRGSVMAGDLHAQLESRGITDVTCDDAPVTNTGAVFICRVAASDGSRATIEATMDREGAISAKQLGDTTHDHIPAEAPPRERHRDPSADPWTQ